MAEAFLNQICGGQFEAHSAGLEPGKLNPIVVEAMQEVGIDISRNQTKSVSDMLKSGKSFASWSCRALPLSLPIKKISVDLLETLFSMTVLQPTHGSGKLHHHHHGFGGIPLLPGSKHR